MYRLTTLRAVCAAITVLCALAVPSQAQTIEYYHVDALGSVRAVTNQSGAVIERHDYLPFGEEVSPPSGAQSHQFTGQERDAETGMDYFGARYYSGKRARFTTVDPVITLEENLVDPQRWNRYAYARDNPLRYTDPDGRILFDFQEFKANLTEALHFGQSGYGYVVPAVAGIAAIGSAASDALIITGGAVNVIKAVGREGLKRVASAVENAGDNGRAGRQARLKELGTDPNVSSADRGWITQEMNQIERGTRGTSETHLGRSSRMSGVAKPLKGTITPTLISRIAACTSSSTSTMILEEPTRKGPNSERAVSATGGGGPTLTGTSALPTLREAGRRLGGGLGPLCRRVGLSWV